jgi:hypothetical protein
MRKGENQSNLISIQTNIHRKLGQGGGNTTHGKSQDFLIFRDSFAHQQHMYFRVFKPNSW